LSRIRLIKVLHYRRSTGSLPFGGHSRAPVVTGLRSFNSSPLVGEAPSGSDSRTRLN